jgi:hypothetical protein
MINIKYDKYEKLEKVINNILKNKDNPFIVNFYTAYIYLHYIILNNGTYIGHYKSFNRLNPHNRINRFLEAYEMAKYFLRYNEKQLDPYEQEQLEDGDEKINQLYPYTEYVKDQGYIIDDVYETVFDNIWKLGMRNKNERACLIQAIKYLKGGLI